MLTVLFWIVLALLLLTVVPDPWDARRNIAKRECLLSVLHGCEVRDHNVILAAVLTARSRIGRP